jgi:hypothetical protein
MLYPRQSASERLLLIHSFSASRGCATNDHLYDEPMNGL